MKYDILCYGPSCDKKALYKIAARWSDGIIQELKTYSLCCQDCLEEQFKSSLKRFQQTRLLENETLAPPDIYRLSEGQRDRALQLLNDLEQEIIGKSEAKGRLSS